jgi:AraC family L-rhamnose operon regulatory protein RhaS
LRHSEQPVWPTTPEIRHCFEQLSKAIDRKDNATLHSRLAVHINELFLAALELLAQHDVDLDPALSSSSRTVKLFLDDLSGNRDQLALPWTVNAMAQHCGLRVTAFTKYCRQITNLTPMHYVNRCRVHSAARLLIEEPGLSITDVATTCGFSTSQYFATAFRQHRGCSPKAYRAAEMS